MRIDKNTARINPGESVVDAARNLLRHRLAKVKKVFLRSASLKRASMEDLHQLRVAARRALAAMDVFDDRIAEKPAKWLSEVLKKILGAAGAIRDLDVLTQRIDGGGKSTGDTKELLHAIGKRRRKSHRRLAALYESLQQHNRFARGIKRVLKEIAANTSSEEAFGAWASHRLVKFVDRFFEAADFDIAQFDTVHHFRIKGKELRYALELFRRVLCPTACLRCSEIVEELQERLGHVNDHVVAVNLLNKWLSKEKDSNAASTLKALLDGEHNLREQSLHDFQQWWTPELRAELRDVTSQLCVSDSHVG